MVRRPLTDTAPAGLADLQESATRITANIELVIEGKPDVVRLALVVLLAEGHLLIEDVPGVGKTMLAKALARSIDCSVRRIQFTPDLLPSDVTGVSVFDQTTREFEFKPGAIFANLVVGDEINRASPKTQSALLEAMEERQVTVDGVTHKLPAPFMVMATQNPIEYEGTFPLPEAQLDRFLIRIHLGYPSKTDEILVLDAQQTTHPVDAIRQVTDAKEIVQLQRAVKEIYVDPLIKQYIVEITNATREHEAVYLGASPRGSLAMFRTSQARALLEGRDFVTPDDVKELALVTLGHRIIMSPGAKVKGTTVADVISSCMSRVSVPGARARA